MTGLKEYLQIKSVSVNTGANTSPSYGQAYSRAAVPAAVTTARLRLLFSRARASERERAVQKS
eukprot:SAG22_NODE_6716_length_820_cov_1.305132_2_plen_62_part_01